MIFPLVWFMKMCKVSLPNNNTSKGSNLLNNESLLVQLLSGNPISGLFIAISPLEVTSSRPRQRERSTVYSIFPIVANQRRADERRPPRAAAAAAAAAEAQARARSLVPLQSAATVAGAFDPAAAASAAAAAVAASVAAAHAARGGGAFRNPTANGGAAGCSHGRGCGSSPIIDGGSSGSEGVVLLGKRRRTAVDYQVRALMAIISIPGVGC